MVIVRNHKWARVLAVAAFLGIVGLAVLVIATWPRPSEPSAEVAPDEAAKSNPERATDPQVAEHAEDPVRTPVSPDGTAVGFHAITTSGKRVDSFSAFGVSSHHRRFHDRNALSLLGESDTQGGLLLRRRPGVEALLFVSDSLGAVTTNWPPPTAREHQIVFDDHISLSGQCVVHGSGRPLEDVTLALSRGAMPAEILTESLSFRETVPGGDPHAVRWARTDEHGRFRVRGIDAGLAAVAVRHATHVWIDHPDAGITCMLPRHDITLEFVPIYVLAVQMPPGHGAVLTYQSRGISKYVSSTTASALRGVQHRLAKRYPEAIIIAVAPKRIPPAPAQLRVLMESGWYDLSVQLEPLEGWDGPKLLSRDGLPEPREVRLADVRLHFARPDGTALPSGLVGSVTYWGGTRGMPTLVTDVAERNILPFGDYRLRCRDRVLAESIADVAITIDEPEETFEVRLDPRVARCRVNVADQSGRPVSYFLLQVKRAGKLVQQLSVRGGSTACWLPVGAMDAWVRSLGYKEEPHPIVVDHAGSDINIVLRSRDG